jgi:hypothetical protein
VVLRCGLGDTPWTKKKHAARDVDRQHHNFSLRRKKKAVRALLIGADIRRALFENFSLRHEPKIQIATNRLTGAAAVPGGHRLMAR